MIKITDKTVINTVYLPKLKPSSNLHIVLYGAGEEKYDLGNYEDLGVYENFYKVNLSLENVPDGEYKYCVNDYERGLIIIGDLKETSKAPDDTDTYIQNHIQNDNVDGYISFS